MSLFVSGEEIKDVREDEFDDRFSDLGLVKKRHQDLNGEDGIRLCRRFALEDVVQSGHQSRLSVRLVDGHNLWRGECWCFLSLSFFSWLIGASEEPQVKPSVQ